VCRAAIAAIIGRATSRGAQTVAHIGQREVDRPHAAEDEHVSAAGDGAARPRFGRRPRAGPRIPRAGRRNRPVNAPEFSLMIDVRQILEAPVVIVPDEAARRRLAARFGLSHITAMRAEIALLRAGNVVNASGRLNADVIQPCAISGEDFPVRIDAPDVISRMDDMSITVDHG
jgi:hypothetical protein